MNPQIGFLLDRSLESLRNSNLESAELYLKQALRLQASNPHVLRLLGVICAQRKQYAEAIKYLKDSIRFLPKNSLALSNLGNVFLELKDYGNALDAYDKSIKIDQKYEEAWSNKGNALNELKRYDEAITHYEKALSLRPDYAEAWSNKGNALHELKRYDEAIADYDKALSLRSDYVEAWSNKGNTLNELKLYDEAIAHYDQALNLKPDYAEAWSNKGNALHELKCYDEAITHYDKALSLRPDYVEAWSNKGNTLNELKRYDEAITHYDKALSLNPEFVEAWSNKGNTLYELKRHDEAITHYDKALSLNFDFADAHSNKAYALINLVRHDEAIAHFEKVLSLNPDSDWMHGELLHIKMKVCNWSDFVDSLKKVCRGVLENKRAITPFPLLSLTDDASLLKQSSEIYVQNKYPLNPVLGSILKRHKGQKIRVGYFSSDFNSHPVAILTAELFEVHDRDQFEIIAFSFGVDDNSPIRSRLIRAFDLFMDVRSKSDLEIAKLARELQIDIAIDLGGYTADSRTGIFSYRAAPIQASYIGYLGSMGADYYDYLIADPIIVPENFGKFYTEKIIRLPSYQVNNRERFISDRKFTKEELGFPEKSFIFCCFNNNYKVLPATFEGWMRILKATPDSLLFLYAENQWVEDNLRARAEALGVGSQRLIFGQRLPVDEYLARYRVCDLFLDTFPYNAGTTASDALWVGLPILTLAGRSFSSRVAASLLNAIGLPELITNTQEEYEALAIELATNPQKLAEIKSRLAGNRMTTPLFDTPLFTKKLEAAYSQMYERYQADLPLDNISIC
jgi:protein O-GlcNAc transferase